jgi:hypothetical protein
VLGWKSAGRSDPAEDEGEALLRTFRRLERMRREGLLDPVGSESSAPARKAAGPIQVTRFTVE